MRNLLLTFSLAVCSFLTSCATKTDQQPVLSKEFINPASGYSQVVSVTTGDVKTLYISGQIGEGEGLEAQMRSVLANLEKQLAEGGATFKDIVKMNTYIVDYKPSDLDIFRGVRKEIMGDKDMPASTLVGVHSLALEQWLIEMEAVAVVEIDL